MFECKYDDRKFLNRKYVIKYLEQNIFEHSLSYTTSQMKSSINKELGYNNVKEEIRM